MDAGCCVIYVKSCYAADAAENVAIAIGKYASLCTNQIPCYFLALKCIQLLSN